MPRFAVPVVALLAASVVAAPVPKTIKKADDLQQMEGLWQVETVDEGKGPKPPPPGWEGFYWRVTEGKLHTGTPKSKGYVGAGMTLDQTQSPRHLDVTTGGSTCLYIYELDGDTLKTIHSSTGQPRPTAFAGGQVGTTFVWKRVKDESK